MDTSSFFAYPTVPATPAAPAHVLDRSDAEWAALLAHTQTRRLRRGDTVVAAGERDRALYLLTDGSVEVVGGPTIAAPAVVGEAAFFDDEPCTATLRAATDGEILRLGYDAFEALAAREPVLARELLVDLGRSLATRLRAAGEHAEWGGR